MLESVPDPEENQDQRMKVAWYAVENDLIGGWSVATADKPCSGLKTAAGEVEIACFTGREEALHIAHLHNQFLQEQNQVELEDYRVSGHDEAAEVRANLTLGLVKGGLVTYAGELEGKLVTVCGLQVAANEARPLAILLREEAWPSVMQSSQLHQPMVDMKPPKIRKQRPNPADKLIVPGHVRKVRDDPKA